MEEHLTPEQILYVWGSQPNVRIALAMGLISLLCIALAVSLIAGSTSLSAAFGIALPLCILLSLIVIVRHVFRVGEEIPGWVKVSAVVAGMLAVLALGLAAGGDGADDKGMADAGGWLGLVPGVLCVVVLWASREGSWLAKRFAERGADPAAASAGGAAAEEGA